jgi:DNA-binding phage protein
MDNKKTSKKQKKYFTIKDLPIVKLKKNIKTREHDPLKNLLDTKFIAEALVECLLSCNKEGFLKILEAHILAQNVSELERRTKVRRSTIYAAIAKDANPTIGTVMALLKKGS